jgi:hypothetical protein
MAFHDEQSYPANRSGVPEFYQGFTGAAAEAHDKPGVFFLEYIDGSGNKGVLYLWADSQGQLRTGSSIPTNQDTAEGGRLPQVQKLDIDANFGNTEQDTGWDLPDKCVVLNVWVDVTTADTGETLDVGTDGSGSNDPNGFLDGISVNATGVIKGTLTNGVQTVGALLYVDESGAGVLVPEPDVTSGGESVTYTGSAATNTMRGSIYILYIDLT